MLESLGEDVSQWLVCSLEAYYLICVHMIHCKLSVEIGAFYVVLTVREDKWREVLEIFNEPIRAHRAGARCSQSCKNKMCGKSVLSVLTD